jgi:CheY-like chemotaxis protein/two-component sensor histidine kinase
MNRNPRKRTILIAEDDHLLRHVAEEIIREAGYEVVAVADGDAALETLELIQPDLILSDVRMPRFTGLELLQRVRSKAAYSFTPFILLSAKTNPADVRSGMSLGADDYVTKPFLSEDLLKTIELRLARAASLVEAQRKQHQFLAQVLPHELRSPLCGVMGYADLMLDTARSGRTLSSPEVLEYGTNIRRSGQRLLQVAENFSLWAWLQQQVEGVRQGRGVERVEASVSSLLVEEWLEPVVSARGRKSDVSLDLQPAVVQVPAQGLGGVLANLVDNALKFSPTGTPVSVRGASRGSNYEFLISDRGRNVMGQESERVGGAQASGRSPRNSQGLGFGLTLARDFARLAGGDFYLTSHPPEPGMTARLHVPMDLVLLSSQGAGVAAAYREQLRPAAQPATSA